MEIMDKSSKHEGEHKEAVLFETVGLIENLHDRIKRYREARARRPGDDINHPIQSSEQQDELDIKEYLAARDSVLLVRSNVPSLPALPEYMNDPIAGLRATQQWCIEAWCSVFHS